MPQVTRSGSVLICREDLIPDRALEHSDSDQFDYEPIAAQVAELVATGDTPLNVALFGPWGSGKSSFGELLRRNLEGRPREAQLKFVPYEAWRYAGESLKRHFIGHLADALNFSERTHPQYYRGLYQEKKTVELSRGRSVRLALLVVAIFLLLCGLILTIWASIDGLHALLDDKSFRTAFKESLLNIDDAILKAPILVALIVGFLPLVRVDLQQSAPSADEEFVDRFTELTQEAATRRNIKRLVIFIDELDRCPANDVVEVISAIKTFLGSPNCVFVVAADRQVVEQALRIQLDQATAVNVEHPYYSAVSSFIEKIFQHQISLPPIRGARLTAYAIELMDTRQGIWRELRANSPTKAEDVAVALVPSHIRSPRQVKQLLNNFATNMRIAEARGLEYVDRAEEIAKLTVLDTEFSSFATSMRSDLKLLRVVADPNLLRHDRLSNAMKALRKAAELVEPITPAVTDEPNPVSPMLIPTPKQLRERQFEELMRYLHRTAKVRGPRADLFYLGPVAPELDRSDPALGETLELLATDVPEEAVSELSERDRNVSLKAIEYLGGMLDNSYGEERDNVMTTLAILSRNVEGDMDQAFRASYEAVRAYALDKAFAPEQLIGALNISLAGEGPRGGQIATGILRDPVVWGDEDLASAAIDTTSRVDGEALAVIGHEIARSLERTPHIAKYGLGVIPIEKLLSLSEELVSAVRRAVRKAEQDNATGVDIASLFLDAAAGRREDAESVLSLVSIAILSANLPSTYQLVKDKLESTGMIGPS